VVPQIGQTSSGDKADITGADHGNFLAHRSSQSLGLAYTTTLD
jgi:hypothetical protein